VEDQVPPLVRLAVEGGVPVPGLLNPEGWTFEDALEHLRNREW
jgi:hypothetical protein